MYKTLPNEDDAQLKSRLQKESRESNTAVQSQESIEEVDDGALPEIPVQLLAFPINPKSHSKIKISGSKKPTKIKLRKKGKK